jgi:UDP-glucuronate decarboxylase
MNKIVFEDCRYAVKSADFSALENSTILISGAAGFLGFNFLHNLTFLADNGIKPGKIIGVDNYILGYPRWIDAIQEKYDFIKVDKFNIMRDSIEEIVRNEHVDYVIHMASIASPSFYRKYPIETIDANIWGLRSLLEFFKERDLKSFLFFSSSEVYGDPSSEFIPTLEDYRGNAACIGPRACYDESKRFGETLCYSFNKIYSLSVKIVRPFNNYGPGLNINDKRVVADFAKSIIENKDIIMHSDGSPTRTFCYAADAMAGYWKTLFYDDFGVFNIGIDEPEISVKELAEIYRETGERLFNYSGNIVFKQTEDKEYLIDNPGRRCPDITKAKNLLGYNPGIKVREGVERYLNFLKDTLII